MQDRTIDNALLALHRRGGEQADLARAILALRGVPLPRHVRDRPLVRGRRKHLMLAALADRPATTLEAAEWVKEALLPKSTEGRMSPFPGQTYPTVSVTGTPSAVKPFRNERAKATGPREPANDTDLELGDLTVEVARHEALTQQFDTVHPIAGKTVPRTVFWPGSYLDAASAVIAFGAALGPVAGGPLTIVARWFDRSGVMRAGLRCAQLHPRCQASRV